MPSGMRMLAWPVVIVLLLAGPAMAAALSSPTPVQRVHLVAPTIENWSGPQTIATGWEPSFSGAAGQVKAAYRLNADSGVVELFHAIYTGKPRRGHTLITFGNRLFDPERTQLLSSGSRPLMLIGGRRLTAGELQLSGTAGPRLVWYWYCVDDRCTRSPMLTKLLQARDVLSGKDPHSSVWALSAPVPSGGIDQTRAALSAFARALPAGALDDVRVHRERAASGDDP
jgi:EpsI family protein